MIHDLAIIGTGPAGISAAIYAARGQLSTAIFGDETKGGLARAHVISNYFGVAGNPAGPELIKTGLDQAVAFGAEHRREEIVDLSLQEDGLFLLKSANHNSYRSRTVIIATGQSLLLAGIREEREFAGRGVSYCVTCDGYFYKNKPVVVVGNGDYAAEEALQLSAYSSDITILSHGKPFRIGDDFLRELQNKKISLLVTPKLASFSGENALEKITFTSPLSDGRDSLTTQGAFMAIGMAGANAFAKKLGLEMNGSYIKTDQDGKTNIKGLFAAGDCTGAPAQVAASVGNGCNAALAAIKLIRGLNSYIQYN